MEKNIKNIKNIKVEKIKIYNGMFIILMATIFAFIIFSKFSNAFARDFDQNLINQNFDYNMPYNILSELDNSKCFDIPWATFKENVGLEICRCKSGKNQAYFFKKMPDGSFVIKNANSNFVLGIKEDKAINSNAVEQQEEKSYPDNLYQRWDISKNSDGTYFFKSVVRNNKNEIMQMDIHNASNANGTKIEIYKKHDGKNQRFRIKSAQIKNEPLIEDGIYKIASKIDENQALDVPWASVRENEEIQLFRFKNGNNQLYQFKKMEDGTYVIKNVNSNLVLGIKNDELKNANSIVQEKEKAFPQNVYQRWIIIPNSDSSFSIVALSRSNNIPLLVDLHEGKTSNGTKVEIFKGHGGKNQRFVIKKEKAINEAIIENGYYSIRAKRKNDLGLDIFEAKKDEFTKVELYKYNMQKNQIFNIRKMQDGTYIIKNINSDLALGIKNNEIVNGNSVVQEKEKAFPQNIYQRWIIIANSDGTFSFENYSRDKENNSYRMDIHASMYQNSTNIEIYKSHGGDNQRFFLNKENVDNLPKDNPSNPSNPNNPNNPNNIKSEFNIDINKYPNILEKVRKLEKIHPNWKFVPLYTNLDFNEVTKIQYEKNNYTINLINTAAYHKGWIKKDGYISGVWASPSKKAISYFIDIRNFLNDIDVFQFLDVNKYNKDGESIEGLKSETKNTFLEKFTNDLNEACIKENVNPYYVLARLIQEQGRRGSIIATGMEVQENGVKKHYYNPFNIGAVVGNDYNTALNVAKKNNWDTMEKAIIGGIKFLKEYWLENCQNTLYQNKFDIDIRNNTPPHTHQYMQNLSAAYSEARILRGAYLNCNKINASFTFVIPLYENMPKEVSKAPKEDEDQTSFTIMDAILNKNSKIYSKANVSSNVILSLGKNTEIVLIEGIINNRFARVAINNGSSVIDGYVLMEDIQILNNKKYAKEKVRLDADGYGAFLRSGPGTNYSKKKLVSDNETLERIEKCRFKNSGYFWDRVILKDGSIGYIATDFLKVK